MTKAIINNILGSNKSKFKIVNRYTNEVVGSYNDVKRARRKRDKLDNDYGSYAYAVIEEETNKHR